MPNRPRRPSVADIEGLDHSIFEGGGLFGKAGTISNFKNPKFGQTVPGSYDEAVAGTGQVDVSQLPYEVQNTFLNRLFRGEEMQRAQQANVDWQQNLIGKKLTEDAQRRSLQFANDLEIGGKIDPRVLGAAFIGRNNLVPGTDINQFTAGRAGALHATTGEETSRAKLGQTKADTDREHYPVIAKSRQSRELAENLEAETGAGARLPWVTPRVNVGAASEINKLLPYATNPALGQNAAAADDVRNILAKTEGDEKLLFGKDTAGVRRATNLTQAQTANTGADTDAIKTGVMHLFAKDSKFAKLYGDMTRAGMQIPIIKAITESLVNVSPGAGVFPVGPNADTTPSFRGQNYNKTPVMMHTKNKNGTTTMTPTDKMQETVNPAAMLPSANDAAARREELRLKHEAAADTQDEKDTQKPYGVLRDERTTKRAELIAKRDAPNKSFGILGQLPSSYAELIKQKLRDSTEQYTKHFFGK